MKFPAKFSFAGAVVLSVSLFTSVYAQFNQVPDEVEYQALKDLYDSTNGEGWTNNSNWLNGTTHADFATWFGIEVQNGDIWAIRLGENNLDGSIPASIGSFKKMRYLHLFNNKLRGIIPAEIGTIPLGHLKLSHNDLSGSIPGTIFKRSIQQIMLAHNNLSGSLPEFGNVSIKYLILNHNKLSGPIPESFGNIRGLYRLYLNDNLFSGLPQSIGNHTVLEKIRLFNNKLTGEIPASIGNMTVLKYLELNNNQLTGTLPPSIGKLKNLVGLSIKNNNLNQPLPDSMVYMSNLTHLDLMFNNIPGTIPGSIGNLKRLQTLYLSGNNFEGQVPESIGFIPNLYTLHLADNNFAGTLPESISQLTKLKNLNLSNNNFEGLFPEGVSAITSINHLSIVNNSFTSFPSFEGNINASNFNITVSNNMLKFQHLETNMKGPNQPIFKQYLYDTQTPPPADILAFTNGQLVILDAEDHAPHNRYQWQKIANGNWTNLLGATSGTYTIASVTDADATSYRCRITNEWVTNLTIFSKTFAVQTTSEFWSVADGNWTADRIWSTTKGGSPVTGYPHSGSKVYIVGNNVTLSDDITCGPLEVIVENREASLTVDGAEMIVHGEIKLKKATEGYPGNVRVINGGKIKPE